MGSSTIPKKGAPKRLSDWLLRGEVGEIARKTGISRQAVHKALRKANPGHEAVKAALEIIARDGRQEKAQQLEQLVSGNQETVGDKGNEHGAE